MGELNCDKSRKNGTRCGHKAYVEVYFCSSTCGPNNELCKYGCTHHWCYLCFWHFVVDFIVSRLKGDGNGYCYVSYERTFWKRIRDKSVIE